MKILFSLSTLFVILTSCNASEKKTTTSESTISSSSTTIENPILKESMNRGKIIYTDFCVVCHMPNGQGVPKVFPPLAQSDYLINFKEESIKAVKYGQSGELTVNGILYNNVMAPLGLENDEIADVMNYINNSWGNTNSTLITEQEVSEIEQ